MATESNLHQPSSGVRTYRGRTLEEILLQIRSADEPEPTRPPSKPRAAARRKAAAKPKPKTQPPAWPAAAPNPYEVVRRRPPTIVPEPLFAATPVTAPGTIGNGNRNGHHVAEVSVPVPVQAPRTGGRRNCVRGRRGIWQDALYSSARERPTDAPARSR